MWKQLVFFFLLNSSIFINGQDTKTTCNNLIPQSGINVSKLVGKWNVIKTTTDIIRTLNLKEDEQECLKFHLLDLFPKDEKFVSYMTWPIYDEWIPVNLRLYGIDPHVNETGKWFVTTNVGSTAEVRILHTDYNTLLSVSCDGDDAYSVTMMSRESTLSDEIIQAYIHYLETFEIHDLQFIDFSHDVCNN